MTPDIHPGASTRGSTAVLRVVLIYAGFSALWILLSDRAVGLVARNPGQIILLSTLKGWFFVGVTSLLLYRLIRYQLAPEAAPDKTGGRMRRLLPPVVILGFFILVLTLVGARQAYHQQEVLEGARLQAIADLKARQITDWVGERMGDARFTASSRIWAKLYHHWRLTGDPEERLQIVERMESFRRVKAFQNSCILDDTGAQVLPFPGTVASELAEGARTAARSGQIQVVGPYRDAAGRFRLDFLAPMAGEDGAAGPVVVLGTDPSAHLFPILQVWPVPSETGEVVLFRREGDQVLFLNDSRIHPGRSFGKRAPLAGPPLLATRFVLGQAAAGTLLKGHDYSGTAVAGVAQTIPGTDWGLVAKIDQAELDAGARGQVAIIGLAGLLGLFLAALAHHLFRQQRILAESERERALQARFKQLFEAAPVPMCLLGEGDRMVALNGQFTRTFGYGLDAVKDLGRWLQLAYPDPGGREASRALWDLRPRPGQGTAPFEATLACADGGARTVQVSATAVGGETLVTFTDLTERVKAEQERQALQLEFQQAQKMESVGRLAGGVAHDFNNMLGVIVANAEIGLLGDPASPAHARFEEILKAAQRSADLTRQLLAFARKQTVSPKVIDLNEAIPGMLQMLTRLIGENITLDYTQRAGLWLIRMDPSQVDQILANLAVNARDAITGVGSMGIQTENLELGEGTRHRPGQYVVLEVTDTGCGMDEEHLKHIFEPFFTTKGVGKGTGLGLATVYGIVEQNGGFLEVESEVGRGTTLRVHLPRYEGPEATDEAVHPAVAPGGREAILVVEDEPLNLSVTVMLLESLGYGVQGAASPREALKVLESGAELQLLLTDVIMPEMNGRELAARARTLRPGLKCLYMSGYADDLLGGPQDGPKLVGKPFTLKQLAASVREALDA